MTGPSPGRPLRVCLLGAVDLISSGLESMLSPYPDRLRVVRFTRLDVDVLLVDTSSPSIAGPYLRRLSRDGRQCLLLFDWSTSPEVARLGRADGVSGHLSMRLSADELVAELETCWRSAGGTSSPDDVPGAVGRPSTRLSEREAQVIDLICQGLTNQEIARELFVGVNSVKTHVRGAYRKLGLERRVDVVAWGIATGFSRSAVP